MATRDCHFLGEVFTMKHKFHKKASRHPGLKSSVVTKAKPAIIHNPELIPREKIANPLKTPEQREQYSKLIADLKKKYLQPKPKSYNAQGFAKVCGLFNKSFFGQRSDCKSRSPIWGPGVLLSKTFSFPFFNADGHLGCGGHRGYDVWLHLQESVWLDVLDPKFLDKFQEVFDEHITGWAGKSFKKQKTEAELNMEWRVRLREKQAKEKQPTVCQYELCVFISVDRTM